MTACAACPASGEPRVTCHVSRVTLPRPEKECPELPDPDNGQVHLSGRHFQDQAVYTCDRGHTMVGASKRLCQVGACHVSR